MPTCALTADFTYNQCKGGVGGIQKVYLTEFANLSGAGATAPTITAGVITAWTIATGKEFKIYYLDEEMGVFSDPSKYTPESGAIIFEPKIEFTIKGLTIVLHQELLLVMKNYLCMIVLDDNGVYWVFGIDRPMHLVTNDVTSGTKLEDFNGYKLSFSGRQLSHVYQLQAGLITALTAPGV